ncbi:unnamed protein product [Protopolystoma xenopodis]|uniref:Uncharacterized protein n=1 Tax=Protopolystoma xenopodis TaxID=117903 RepID=A0A3S4ZUP8_9PLAT|nr:unnamed protein product [Protopolystoma xenopodis]
MHAHPQASVDILTKSPILDVLADNFANHLARLSGSLAHEARRRIGHYRTETVLKGGKKADPEADTGADAGAEA